MSGADAVVVVMVRSRARDRAAIPAVELRWRDGERKLRADQEEGDAPHGPVPKRATPSKHKKKKKKRRSCPSIFSKMGEHALCGAHWQKRRPPHEIEQWRQSTVCRKVSSVHEERASGKQPGLPPQRARCCSRLPEARKQRAARQNEVGSQFPQLKSCQHGARISELAASTCTELSAWFA